MRVFLATIALSLSLTTTSAHEYITRDGRRIDYTGNGCCNGTDCRPVKDDIGTDKDGNLVVITDDDLMITVPKKLVRKPSKDRSVHVCAKSIPEKAPGEAHCIFIPVEANMTKRPLFAARDLERDLRTNICKTN